MCFVKLHKPHDCKDITEFAEEMKIQIISDLDEIHGIIVDVDKRIELLRNDLEAHSGQVTKIEREILKRKDEIKQLVEDHTEELLPQLHSTKIEKEKEIED